MSKVHQKKQSNGKKSNNHSKIEEKLIDPPQLVAKAQSFSQRQKMVVQNYLRPQSTKSNNYGSLQNTKREQFDIYFKNHQSNFQSEFPKNDRSRSHSREPSSKDKRQNSYNVQSSYNSTKKPSSLYNSELMNRSTKVFQASLNSSSQQNDGNKSYSVNYGSEKIRSQPKQETDKLFNSNRVDSRTPDKQVLVTFKKVQSAKGSLKPSPRRVDTNKKFFESSRVIDLTLKSGGRMSGTKTRNFKSCHILNIKKDDDSLLVSKPSIKAIKQESQVAYYSNPNYSSIRNSNIDYSTDINTSSPLINLKQNSDSQHSTSIKNKSKVKGRSKPKTAIVKQIRLQETNNKSMTSDSKSTQNTNLSSLVTRVKKGQILPFQTNAATQQKSITNSTVSTTQKSTTPSTQKSTTPTKKRENGESHTDITKYMQPLFVGCKYYQTALLHFHYEQLYGKSSPFQMQFRYAYKSEAYYSYIRGVYEEHFVQSFFSLRYCASISPKPLFEIQNKITYLPPHTSQNYKRTIVFDLDETLIHCNDSNDDPCDFRVKIDFPQSESIDACINIRPFCSEVLSLMKIHYELIVFTASHQCYAEAVLSKIDPQKQIFKHRFFRDSCIQAGDGLYIKDLRVIGNRQLKDILLVDNAAYSFCHQLENGVPIIPFYDNKADQELLYLAQYLIDLEDKKNWLQLNKAHFNMETYQKTQNTEDCLKILLEQEF